MTTPQNILYQLERRIYELCQYFEQTETHNSLPDRVEQIELQLVDIITAIQRLENQMNLIIKLLIKEKND